MVSYNALTPALTNTLFYKDSEEKFAVSRKMVPIWRRAAEIELRGDYYPLTEGIPLKLGPRSGQIWFYRIEK